MSSQLRIKYDRLRDRHREAAARTARAKAKYDLCRADEATLDREMDAARVALDNALDAMAQAPSKPEVDPPKSSASTPRKVPPFLRELVEALPDRPRDVAAADLRAEMGLSESTVNTRIQKAMRADLVERSRYAHYRLTEVGQATKGGPKLHAVSG